MSNCCAPIIEGKRKADTAEALLRARYSAFTRAGKSDVDFIVSSHHSKTRGELNRKEIEEWASESQWLGLQVVQKEAGEAQDDKGTIVFCAKFKSKGEDKEQEHWEQATFEKDKGEWYFLDARGVHVGTYKRTEPKTGRNDPCPCGSGKKFKKCHAGMTA